jgi:hypothetical protein
MYTREYHVSLRTSVLDAKLLSSKDHANTIARVRVSIIRKVGFIKERGVQIVIYM